MQTRTDEIADGIYRLSTYLPDVAAPAGFTVNQFLIDAEEPLLYHCGMRSLFPLVSVAVERIVPLERLRWIGFAHLGPDHVGWSVPRREDLDTWQARLESLGVTFTPVVDVEEQGIEFSVIVLRDPDNIQLELCWTPAAP